MGFDRALEVALEGSKRVVSEDPTSALPTTFLAWSSNLTADAKKGKDKEKYELAARFYRKLAHQLYWNQRALGKIGYISDFIQLVE